MPSEPESLRDRTKAFAIRIIHLFRALPPTQEAQIVGKQILRSGTSVGANYRSTCRARSRQEFAARIGIVLEEADETVFWLELLDETGAVKHERMADLLKEARELTAIFTTAQRTARQKK
jgi:four helix bundle protein